MARKRIETLVEALQDGASIEHRGLSFLDHCLEPEYLSWATIWQESRRMASAIRKMGFEKGEHVGIVVADEKTFVLTFFGTIVSGCIPVAVYPPLPTRKMDDYIERTAHIFRSSGTSRLVGFSQMSNIMDAISSRVPSIISNTTTEILQSGCLADDVVLDDVLRVKPSDIAFIQYTSGSTGQPKGVVLTHEILLAHIHTLIDLIKVDVDNELGISWLPLYHDMGLIGFVLLPAVAHSKSMLLSPLSFVTKPQTWLGTVHKYRGTISASPNFGLALAAKYATNKERLDLSCLRTIICGAEPINPSTVRRFIETFRSTGLRDSVVAPAYGMAEATLCISIDREDRQLKTVLVAKDEYECNNKASSTSPENQDNSIEIVSCGRCIPNHSISIVDPNGNSLPEGSVGEIMYKGASVTKGYFENGTSHGDLFYKGWMRTGDLGFVLGGEIYISGRVKDLIIISARNYYPQSIELIVEELPEIRKGNVVAFSVSGPDTERLVIVAECKKSAAIKSLAKRVESIIYQHLGIHSYDVVIIPPNSMPKTSSGKLQRRLTREAYLQDQFFRVTNENVQISHC